MKLKIKRTILFKQKGQKIPFYSLEDVKDVLDDNQKKNIAKMINELKGGVKDDRQENHNRRNQFIQ